MKKVIKYIFVLAITSSIFFACEVDRTEEVFDSSPAERIDNKIEGLKAALIGEPQGFSGVYFPNNNVVGGINFHMKFTGDLRVKITSDFKEDTSITDSRYDIVTGTTAAELVFTTGSRHITDLVQDGLEYNTFFGNNAFQYVGEEEGVLIFNEVRSGGIFKLSPSGFSDFDSESIASADLTYSNKKEFVDTPLATVFPFLSIEKDGMQVSYNLNYNSENLFASPSGFDENGDAIEEKFGIAFTETGLVISPALEFDGFKFEEFTLDTSSGYEFVSEVDGAIAKIGYRNTPAAPLDIYQFGIADEVAVLNMDESFKNSAAYNKFYADFSANLANNTILPGLAISNIIIWQLNTGSVRKYIDIRTNYGNAFYDISFNFDENTGLVKFQFTGPTNAPGVFTALIQPLLDVLFGSQTGYYAVKSGNYLNFSNSTFGLIDADDATIKFDYWTFNQ